MAYKRKFHSLRGVSSLRTPWHCRDCERYFAREPKAATCRPPKREKKGEE